MRKVSAAPGSYTWLHRFHWFVTAFGLISCLKGEWTHSRGVRIDPLNYPLIPYFFSFSVFFCCCCLFFCFFAKWLDKCAATISLIWKGKVGESITFYLPGGRYRWAVTDALKCITTLFKRKKKRWGGQESVCKPRLAHTNTTDEP